jgi:hypothetical protein
VVGDCCLHGACVAPLPSLVERLRLLDFSTVACGLSYSSKLAQAQVGHSNQFEQCYQAARAGVYPGPPI